MRHLHALFLVIFNIAVIGGQASVGLADDSTAPAVGSVATPTGKVYTLQYDQSIKTVSHGVQRASHDDITRLPPPAIPKPTDEKLAKAKPASVSPPASRADRSSPQRAIAASANKQIDLPIQLFQPQLSENNDRVAEQPQRPTRVETLEFERPRRVVAPAANDHDRLAAENLRVSPLSGVHDFEQSMDVLGMENEPASDAPLTEAERESLSLSAEVRTQANRMLIRAEQLANRGAVFAAKEEFVRALRMVTRSLDAEIGRSYHSRCLARGLQALEEADDFTSQSKCVETDTDLHGFIAGHQTTVLHDGDSTTLTPLIAMRHYYDYAHDQLTKAGAQSPVASKALFAVGRAHSRIRKASTEGEGAPKSLAFYNAALAVDPNNAQAANELAVLLAQTGHLDHAASVLQRSAQVAPSSIGLQNLAHIYQQMGQADAARQVASTHQQLVATPGSLAPTAGQPHQQIMWVSPQTFNQTASAIDETPGLPKSAVPASTVPQGSTAPAKQSGRRSGTQPNRSSSHWW